MTKNVKAQTQTNTQVYLSDLTDVLQRHQVTTTFSHSQLNEHQSQIPHQLAARGYRRREPHVDRIICAARPLQAHWPEGSTTRRGMGGYSPLMGPAAAQLRMSLRISMRGTPKRDQELQQLKICLHLKFVVSGTW